MAKKQLSRSLAGLENLTTPQPVQIITDRWEVDESKISTDPKKLVDESKQLITRTIESPWLLGQRLHLLKNRFNESEFEHLFGKAGINWKIFCKEIIGLSRTHADNLIRIYQQFKYQEILALQIEPSKMAIAATISDKDKRQEFLRRIQKENLSQRQAKMLHGKEFHEATRVAPKNQDYFDDFNQLAKNFAKTRDVEEAREMQRLLTLCIKELLKAKRPKAKPKKN